MDLHKVDSFCTIERFLANFFIMDHTYLTCSYNIWESSHIISRVFFAKNFTHMARSGYMRLCIYDQEKKRNEMKKRHWTHIESYDADISPWIQIGSYDEDLYMDWWIQKTNKPLAFYHAYKRNNGDTTKLLLHAKSWLYFTLIQYYEDQRKIYADANIY